MELTYKTLILRALVVGLIAGALFALYTAVVTGPVTDRAIAVEEAIAAAEEAETGETAGHSHDEEEALFTRSEQKAGGAAGVFIYSVIAAAVFGTVLAAVRHRLPHWTEMGRTILLAAIAFGAVALAPALKYPSTPPAVGDGDTVNERTVQYLSVLVLSIVLAVALVWLSGRLRSRLDDPTRVVVVAASTLAAYSLLFIVLPGTPDSIADAIPAQLVWDFRLRSLGGLALMWATIGLGLGWALDRVTAHATDTATIPAASASTAAT